MERLVFRVQQTGDFRECIILTKVYVFSADGLNRFGASLSYASSDGKSGAASAQVLSNAMIEDNVEVVILSSKSCDDGGCDYTRPGGVAYRKLLYL